MFERVKFWVRCLHHWDRRGHWPENPRVYGDFFLCERCNRGTPYRKPFRALHSVQQVGAFGYG